MKKSRRAKKGEAGASGPKRAKASFKQEQVHSDKLSAYKAGSLSSGTNDNVGPKNRADEALKSMMSHHPVGIKHENRRKK